MKRFEGTQGEWVVSGQTQIVSMPTQCKISNNISGLTYGEAVANAKLIAAAPELLEALIIVKKQMLRSGINFDNAEIYNTINNVISKSLGV